MEMNIIIVINRILQKKIYLIGGPENRNLLELKLRGINITTKKIIFIGSEKI